MSYSKFFTTMLLHIIAKYIRIIVALYQTKTIFILIIPLYRFDTNFIANLIFTHNDSYLFCFEGYLLSSFAVSKGQSFDMEDSTSLAR